MDSNRQQIAKRARYWSNPDIFYRAPQLMDVDLSAAPTEPLVIDDFLDDPMAARAALLKQEYAAPVNPQKAHISFNAQIPDHLGVEIVQKIEKVLDQRVLLHPRSKAAATYAKYPVHNACHYDGGPGMQMFNWTGVIYMNTPEQCQGGTPLFKHKATGHKWAQKDRRFYGADFKNPDAFELTETIEMRFNRLALIPAWLFHRVGHTFGDSIENARLTLNPKLVAFPHDLGPIQTPSWANRLSGESAVAFSLDFPDEAHNPLGKIAIRGDGETLYECAVYIDLMLIALAKAVIELRSAVQAIGSVVVGPEMPELVFENRGTSHVLRFGRRQVAFSDLDRFHRDLQNCIRNFADCPAAQAGEKSTVLMDLLKG
jgi:hypothetical protein